MRLDPEICRLNIGSLGSGTKSYNAQTSIRSLGLRESLCNLQLYPPNTWQDLPKGAEPGAGAPVRRGN